MAHSNLPQCFDSTNRSTSRKNVLFLESIETKKALQPSLPTAYAQTNTTEDTTSSETIKLCNQLKSHIKDKITDEKHRLALFQNNIELRDLTAKIQSAYLRKILSAQIAEKKQIREKERAVTYKEERVQFRASVSVDEERTLYKKTQQKKQAEYRKCLDEQTVCLHQKHLERLEQIRRDKEDIERKVREAQQIQESEERMRLEKLCEFRRDIVEQIHQKEQLKLLEQHKVKPDLSKYQKVLQEREMERQKLRQENRRHHEQLATEVGRQIYEKEMEKVKARKALQELLFGEHMFKDELKKKQELQKKFDTRIALRNECESAFEDKIRRRLEEKEEKKLLRKRSDMIAEREKLEQIAEEEHRRIKASKIYWERTDNVKQKKVEKLEKVQEGLIEAEKFVQEQKKQNQLVEKERLRLLKQHWSSIGDVLHPSAVKEYKKASKVD